MPDLTINHGGKSVPGYLAEPENPRGGMIVIQEWWGLNDDIRGIADRYAAEGFLAFAPDLYHGTLATEPDEARKLAMSLERQIAAEEIDAVIDWMKQERGVAKVGCVGFCMGGGLTLGDAADIQRGRGPRLLRRRHAGAGPARDDHGPRDGLVRW